MAQTGMYHGGLVFQNDDDAALSQFCRIVTATLEDYGHQVDRQSVLNPREARVVCSQYLVKLSLDDRRYRQPDAIGDAPGKSRHRLEIEMIPAASGYEDRDISQLMMVVMLYRMVDICNTEAIEWMDPGTVLTVDQFLSAFTNVSPHRVHTRQEPLDDRGARFAPIEDTAPSLARQCDTLSAAADELDDELLVRLSEEEALSLAFRSDEAASSPSVEETAQNDIRRLATWGLTGMVAFMSAPVAASMAAVNLVRGEDFRLNTQVLSLTGLLAVLQSSGALASAVSYLPI